VLAVCYYDSGWVPLIEPIFGSGPLAIEGITDDVAPGAPATDNGVIAYWDRTTGTLQYKLAGDATPYIVYTNRVTSDNVESVLAAADYAAIRTLLSLVVGTNVQAFDADLSTYAGITPAANVQSLLGAADYAAMRTQLDLVPGADIPAIIAGAASALDTDEIASEACDVTTVSAAGVATTDVIIATLNGTPIGVTGYVPSTDGTLYIYAYPTANNVNLAVCNNTAGAITPGAIVVNWKVIR
jgi:hypothetical protein